MYFYEKKSVDCVKHIKRYKKNKRKCTFSSYVLTIFLFWSLYFHFTTFSPKLINACYFSPFR